MTVNGSDARLIAAAITDHLYRLPVTSLGAPPVSSESGIRTRDVASEGPLESVQFSPSNVSDWGRSETYSTRLLTIRGRAAVHEYARLSKPNGWVYEGRANAWKPAKREAFRDGDHSAGERT
jgi:hypothetical protein